MDTTTVTVDSDNFENGSAPAAGHGGENNSLHDLLWRVSRTFALSNRWLPARLRRTMTVAYLLFRVSDYLEDNAVMSSERKVEMLYLWDAVLAGREREDRLCSELREVKHDDDPEAEVAIRFRELTRSLRGLEESECRALRERVRETTRGMARRQLRGPVVETEEELDEYMHHVAGVVGYLITEVFACFDSRLAKRKSDLMEPAREYGLGLQTVNVIRGLRKDYARGRVYVPRNLLEEVGLEPDTFLRAHNADRSMTVVDRLVEKADSHLRFGLSYVFGMPRSLYRVRLATMWPLLFAAKTLSVSRGNPNVVFSEAKITRRDVARIVRHTMVMGWSNRWLGWYYQRLLYRRNSR